MRVLITGITGFVGSHLARCLDAKDEIEVYGLASSGPAGDRRHVVDVTDRAALDAAIQTCDPQVVVHLAGLSHVGTSWRVPQDYFQVNFQGTVNLVKAAAGRRVIFASSAEVYGNVPEDEQPIVESRGAAPRSPYAITKACAEDVALDHGALVVRSFNSVGPGQSRQFALPSFASQLAGIQAGRLEPKLKVGDLSPRRDFLHIDDAVTAYELLLTQGQGGQIYNLATGDVYSIADALHLLREISGVEAEIEVDPERVRPVDTPLTHGDPTKLKALGWQPRYDLRRALEDLWQETLQLEGENP